MKSTIFWDDCYLGLFFDLEHGGDVPPKRRLTFNGLHGVISRKIVLFTISLCSFLDVRDQVSNPFKTIGKIIV
jgi:hypothetical protein